MRAAEQVEEEQYLLGNERAAWSTEVSLQRRRTTGVLVVVAVLALISAALCATLVINSTYNSSYSLPNDVEGSLTSFKSEQQLTAKTSVSISIQSGYGLDNMMPYPFLQDAHLMEPHRSNTINVTGFTMNSQCEIDWIMQARTPTTNSATIYKGLLRPNEDSFRVAPKATGEYSLLLGQTCTYEVSDTGGALVRAKTGTAEFTIWVKYVRRELMTLTDEDREEFLDAFHTLWEVDTLDGQVRFGAKYKSLHYFAMIHNDAAGNGVCDEFHGGLGFVNNHVYLSSYLEQSLQLVNPRIALHYMDYSKYFESDAFLTGHLSNTMDGGAWTEIMTAKWFGANDPITGRIIDGRWRNSPVPTVDADFFHRHGINESQLFFPAEADRWLPYQSAHMHNTNGQLRARWNLNPVNYTIRYNNVDRIVNAQNLSAASYDKYRGVPCANYYDFVTNNVLNRSLETLLGTMEGRVHGPIHFTFGGAGGEKYHANDDIFRTVFNFSDSDLAFITQLSHTYMKSEAPKWWTGGKAMTNWNCTFPAPVSGPTDEILTLQAQLDLPGGLNWPGEAQTTHCDANEYYYKSKSTLNEFIDLFFEPLAAASAELSDRFRALPEQKKRYAVHLLNTRYQFDGDMATSAAAIDPLFWVQHGAVERLYQRILFENVLTEKAYTTLDKCSGHSADGTKYWLTGFTFEDPTVRPETLTNAQLAEILDPTSTLYRDNVNFVYDTRSFGFCSEFEALFAGDAS